MRFLQNRYTAKDLVHLFVLCAFPIHVWSIIIMLRNVPSWLLYMRGSEMMASAAYHLTFTIFETILVFLLILLLGLLTPPKWLPEPFLTLSAVLLFEISIMAIVFQHLVQQYSPLRWMFVTCLLILSLTIIVVPRVSRLPRIIRFLAERLTILTFIYVFFDVIGVAIVIVRNL